MSKKVKSLVERDIAKRLGDFDAVAVINPRGINAIKNNLIRRRLHEKGLRMTVVKNSLARRAMASSRKWPSPRLSRWPCSTTGLTPTEARRGRR